MTSKERKSKVFLLPGSSPKQFRSLLVSSFDRSGFTDQVLAALGLARSGSGWVCTLHFALILQYDIRKVAEPETFEP